MQKVRGTKQYGVTVAGIVILTLAVIIIFLVIFVPQVHENRILQERISLLLYAEYERVLLSDPLLETEGTVLDRGAQVMLLEAEVDVMREKLAAVAEAGFHNSENVAKIEGAWDMKLQLRTTAGEYADLYFTETALYFYADGTAFCFEAKDVTAYNALFAFLQSTLMG